MGSRTWIRGAAAVALLATAFPAGVHSQTDVAIRVGYASATSEYADGRESGPELGVGITRWLTRTLGLEAQFGATAYPTAVAEPVCLPDVLCQSVTYSPGSLLGAQVGVALRPAGRVTLHAGAGYTLAMEKVAGPDSERLASTALHAGIRVTPFSVGGRGLAIELRGARFTEAIGSLRWVIAPGVSWSF